MRAIPDEHEFSPEEPVPEVRAGSEQRGELPDLDQRYLRATRALPLLKPREQLALAREVRLGRAAVQRLLGRLGKAMKREEIAAIRKQLARRQVALEQARQAMVLANLRLVLSIASHYRFQGMPLIDLVQEGTIGLMQAIERFDDRRGLRLSTYATWWIRQAVTRALGAQVRTIRLPTHVIERVNRLLRSARLLRQTVGREPTSPELAAALGWPEHEIEEVRAAMRRTVSFDECIGPEGEDTFEEFLEDVEGPGPDAVAIRHELADAVRRGLSILQAREEEIVRRRYGIGLEGPETLSQIGRRLHLTRERIRQIERRAIERLGRSPALRGAIL